MITIEQLNYTYSMQENDFSIRNFSLHLHKGEFFGLFGKDDVGKTSLLHILMGYLHARQGKCLVKVQSSEIRYLPDNIYLEKKMTVEQYLSFQKTNSLHYNEEFEQDLVDVFSCDIHANMLELTYEQNKIVTLIGAVAAKPELLVLDEPHNFLSDEMYDKVMKALIMLNKSGTTILMTAETFLDAASYATRVGYMKHGELVHLEFLSSTSQIRNKIIRIKEMTGALHEKDGFIKLCTHEDETIFLYQGEPALLHPCMATCHYQDIHIEDTTWEEEYEKDYTRWL